jgi:hypothetical protein
MKLRSLDWEALAAIAAAVLALVLHLLHLAETDVFLAVIMVILALMILRDLRRERRDEQESEALADLRSMAGRIESALTPPEVVLIGPRRLRPESERFAREAQGEMIWFNVCLSMFDPQELFDTLLKPAIENPRVTAIQFVLSPDEQERWTASVLPKAARLETAAKLREPRWVAMEENISFIIADNAAGAPEAHVSFWGEPFMARQQSMNIPRFVLHVQAHSQLMQRLIELERSFHARPRVS